MQVLAGDIGGTKVLLQLCKFERGAHRVLAEERFESASYDGLLPLVREFLSTVGPSAAPQAACFGIAGPITGSVEAPIARVTNLPWVVEALPLSKQVGIPRVRLINDFQAVGYGIEMLGQDDLVVLQSGEAKPGGPCAVIGAGTGLGQALRVWHDDHYEVVPTEGGHVDFAPTDDLQVDLLRYLREHHGRVSCERIVSGPGIASLYAFLAEREGKGGDLRQDEDAPATITTAALQRNDPIAVAALQLFVKIYGAHSGNVALSYLATGGVYIAGGIAPKILPALRDGTFMRAFKDKGRMSSLLVAMPVYMVMNERVGLLGAALAASRLR